MWVKMASLLWMLLTAPENSRISVDSSTRRAGRSLQSTASCEPSTLQQTEGHSSEQGKVLMPKARRGWQNPATGTGLYHQDVPSWDEGATLILHPSKICHSRDWAKTEKAPGMPGGRAGSLAVPSVSSHLYTSSLNAGIS